MKDERKVQLCMYTVVVKHSFSFQVVLRPYNTSTVVYLTFFFFLRDTVTIARLYHLPGTAQWPIKLKQLNKGHTMVDGIILCVSRRLWSKFSMILAKVLEGFW